jgi:hypothetical protein
MLFQINSMGFRSGEPAFFVVEKMTIEVNFVVTESKEATGGLDLKIITAGGRKEYQQQQIHKITLDLVVPPSIKKEVEAAIEKMELIRPLDLVPIPL